VDTHGCVTVDQQAYDVKQTWVGQRVVLFVNAQIRAFDVWLDGMLIKEVPIKGLRGESMPFERYVDLMGEEARSGARPLLQKKGAALRHQSLWAEGIRVYGCISCKSFSSCSRRARVRGWSRPNGCS
jgi:hypothetical protein